MDIKKRQPLGIELVRRGIVDGEAIERALQYQMDQIYFFLHHHYN